MLWLQRVVVLLLNGTLITWTLESIGLVIIIRRRSIEVFLCFLFYFKDHTRVSRICSRGQKCVIHKYYHIIGVLPQVLPQFFVTLFHLYFGIYLIFMSFPILLKDLIFTARRFQQKIYTLAFICFYMLIKGFQTVVASCLEVVLLKYNYGV